MSEAPDSELAFATRRAALGYFKLFLATPIYDNWVHHAYMMGAVNTLLAFPGELIVHKQRGSYQPSNRNQHTWRFLQSDATHFLCVDPDLGWSAVDVLKLLEARRDFVSGIYARKQADRAPAVDFSTARDGALIEAESVGAGFLLLTRACLQRLVAAHPELNHERDGNTLCAIWQPQFNGRAHYGEEATFCAHWRALGERIWVHSQVVLKRHGETSYYPRGFAERAEPERAEPVSDAPKGEP